MRIYILGQYGEYGPEVLLATSDPAKLSGMVASYFDTIPPGYSDKHKSINSTYRALALERLADFLTQGNVKTFHDTNENLALIDGWGGLELHVIDMIE